MTEIAAADLATLVSVVVVPRERYSCGALTLEALLDTVPDGVAVVVVRGGMPRHLEAQIESIGGDRIHLVGAARHLAPNAARVIGLREVTTQFVAVVDNDVVPRPGWLEALVRTAIDHDAWVVRPVVLQTDAAGTTIHESGGDCHIHIDADGGRTLFESHRHLGAPLAVVESLETERVELFEFHAVLFDRCRLEELGGPDEQMLSQGDHLTLALRIHDAGGSIWLEPTAVVAYPIPDRLSRTDVGFFLGRWSPSWTDASRAHFATVHGLSDDDRCCTWSYPSVHRSYAWFPLGRIAHRVTGRSTPQRWARIFDRLVGARLADATLRLDPRWRGSFRG